MSASRVKTRQSGAALLVKRLFDVSMAVVAITVTSPIMAAVAVAVASQMGLPVLFRQLRPGRNGHPFVLLKFRTMVPGAGSDGERLTPLGRTLRRFSLDELPQLFNVLAGDMSLVGPRPLLMEYLSEYSRRHARRHEVLPGITGWAQIHGRNALRHEERFELDVWYVDNWSLWLDARILARTGLEVLRGRGIHAAGHATMPRYSVGRPESFEG